MLLVALTIPIFQEGFIFAPAYRERDVHLEQITRQIFQEYAIERMVLSFFQDFERQLSNLGLFSQRQYQVQPRHSFSFQEFIPQFSVVQFYHQLQPVNSYRQFIPQTPIAQHRQESFPQERYTNLIEDYNHIVHARAKETNQDGGAFLQSVIRKQDRAFRRKAINEDPEIFVPNALPAFAVKELISSKDPLTRHNTPHFAHAHLTGLNKLREGFDKNLRDTIATAFSRERNFIAAAQNALRGAAAQNALRG